ncbi:hypothetical protein COU49_01265 [Candidatus Nomurabacteria bacterium CG10_big_fil_rev_8_21_14_0_10_35_16]|uniref:SHS2 domain-containing protein n=1 Tax=Candidatus Nomurabacteria bacterium CG10_big_fil_rev_8_21_14_0_10_35_16 TaxID=1974731 RepID=A0A2H0TBJ7_9BACT|nr:MAG: hypothetical protein COU49_01265 [Candidatus Nomurabacteria bacterium CG10_big_fil_rev_8_21_14_0_10_35_16]
MGIFTKRTKAEKSELVAVFDIGSASVGGALFFVQKSGVPKIVFSVREKIIPQPQIDPKNLLTEIRKALNNVARQMAVSNFGAPKKIFCVLSSMWHISHNRVIRIKKNTPFVFTDKLANGLIEKELKLFKEDYLGQYVKNDKQIRVIELKNIKTTLNGYEVLNPYKQKANDLEMTLFISMAEEEVLSNIEDVIAQHFHTRDVVFSSFIMASFTVVRDMHSHQKDFILIDIGGEITDISIIKNNALIGSASYPLGSNFIARDMASILGSNLEEAKTFFSLYKDGHAEERIHQRFDPIVKSSQTRWLDRFQSSLNTLLNDISIPNTIYLTIDKEFADFFINIIQNEQFNQYILTSSKFNIKLIDNSLLYKVAAFEKDTTRDVFLIMDAIYINRF